MLYRLGRIFQILGMAIIPVAMAGNVYDQRLVPLGKMLLYCAIGILVFGFGWLLQQAGLGCEQ